MIALTLERAGGDHVVLAFGMGLIGSATLRALSPAIRRRRTIPYDWADGTARARARDAIAAQMPPRPAAVSVVWTGGRSGFGSSVSEMDEEAALLQEVLDLADALRRAAPEATHAIHLASSAGGLFEGQRFCDARTEPAPMRPYGEGKLRQEEMTLARGAEAGVHVYRPSSVYGPPRSGRVGLVTALIGNALRGATTRIVGSASTLRDYVHADDVGRFIAGRVMAGQGPDPDRSPFLLARGRSATMTEVIAHVEGALDARLRLQFAAMPENARDMSFRPSALPAGWPQIDLATGIARIAGEMRSRWAERA